MPTYNFKDNETDEIIELFLSMGEREEYLKNNPHMSQILLKPPSVDAGGGLTVGKPDSGFRDVLKNIKSHHPGSRSIKNTINDW
jgi:hypothetical protein